MKIPESFYPLVSIVIPVYNGANYLREAIDSALEQTYDNIEVLVINDGSDDGGATEEIALSYGDRIRYFRKENGGVASALNRGIREMRGEYFSWLSHDDLYCEDKVSKQIDGLRNQEDKKKIVYSDCVIFEDDANKLINIIAGKPTNESMRYHLTVRSSIHGCSFLIPRAAFHEVGDFNQDLRYTQDYDMWFRLATHYEYLYIPGTLVRSRHHPAQDSSRYRVELRNACDNLRVSFIANLSENEVEVVGAKTLSSYLYLYGLMKRCGYEKSARVALGMAYTCASKNDPAARALNLLEIIITKLDIRYNANRILAIINKLISV